MLCTVLIDRYARDDRTDLRDAIEAITDPDGQRDWSTQGVYAYWDPESHEILYLGLADNLTRRFSEHNGLIKVKPGSSKLIEIDAFLDDRGSIGFSILIQSKAVQVWEDMEELELGIGTTAKELIAGGEGQLIECHRLAFGSKPPWNKIGGSKKGASYAKASPSLLQTLAGARRNCFVGRRTIRDMSLDIGVRFREAAIHNARMRALLEEHDLVTLPKLGEAVDIAKLEKSMLVRSGLLIDDLDVGDEVVMRWLRLFADPETWKSELEQQKRLGKYMVESGPGNVGQDALDYMNGLVTSAQNDPLLDAYSKVIQDVLKNGYLDDWGYLDGVVAAPQ